MYSTMDRRMQGVRNQRKAVVVLMWNGLAHQNSAFRCERAIVEGLTTTRLG